MTIEELAHDAEQAISAYERARHSYADAVRVEQQMEADRVVVKHSVIGRIMQTTNELTGKPHSATSAESAAPLDEEYRSFLLNARNVVHAKLRAETAFRSADLQAQLAICLSKTAMGVS